MLDHKYYPHIFDLIISHLDAKGLQAMRPTSTAINNKVYGILYRHILVETDAPFSDLMFVRDPYTHRKLLVLDKTIPHSRRLRGSDSQRELSFKDVMDRLTEHTRIFDFACPMRHIFGLWREMLTLNPLTARARVSRQLCLSASLALRLVTRHHCSIVATFLGRDAQTGPLFEASTVFTLGVPVPSHDMLVVIKAGRRESVAADHVPFNDELFANLCEHLESQLDDIRFFGAPVNSITFIELEKDNLQPLNLDWKRAIPQFQSWWATKTRHYPKTFTHMSAAELQNGYGLNDFQFAMLTTVPDWKPLAQPRWH